MTQTVSLSNADPVVRHTADLLEQLFPSPRDFGIRLWDGSEMPVEGRPLFSLVLNHRGRLCRVCSSRPSNSRLERLSF